MKERKKITRTLFDSELPAPSRQAIPSSRIPYDIRVEALADSADERYAPDELVIFDDVLRPESSYYAPRGYLAGDITIGVRGRQPRRLDRKPFPIPGFVEDDFLEFLDCAAEGVILVERVSVFELLRKCKEWSNTKLLLLTGAGLPRVNTRRLLHRIRHELSLPALVLTDNDTWGYFIVSMVRRGLLGPDAQNEFLSVRDARWIGIRSGDLNRYALPDSCVRPWKAHWSLRIESMRGYRCFRSKAWQTEFDAFLSQHRAVDLQPFVEGMGASRFINEYLVPRIRDGDTI